MDEHSGREIPWLETAKFHKEICIRAENSSFSLNASDLQSEQWSSLRNFDPDNFHGPWKLNSESIVSSSFKNILQQRRNDSVFLGGPVQVRRGRANDHYFLPLLYLEINIKISETTLEVIPFQGNWHLNPKIYRELDYQSITKEDVDKRVSDLVEKSAKLQKQTSESLATCIQITFAKEFPELKNLVLNENSPWVLFTPAQHFSAINRHIINDYQRLEQLLSKNDADIGGLINFEDQSYSKKNIKPEIRPLLPLNKSQHSAVENILSEKPISVISGPPGCGKSQVVVASLLNAWKLGKKVLFVSTNNKAVDVVKERLEKFDPDFPIAIRAGSKEKNNIIQFLRKTQKILARSEIDDEIPDYTKQLQELSERKKQLQAGLDQKLPQRIHEASSSALQAYAEYRNRRAEINQLLNELRVRSEKLGFANQPFSVIRETHNKTREWLNDADHYRQLIDEDEIVKNTKQTELDKKITERNRKSASFGLDKNETDDWNWLINGPNSEMLVHWQHRMQNFLQEPIGKVLDAGVWDTEYDRWSNSRDVQKWSMLIQTFRDSLCEILPEYIQISYEFESEKKKLDDILNMPKDLSVRSDDTKSLINKWQTAYGKLSTLKTSRLNLFSWFKRNKLTKSLNNLEQSFQTAISFEIWQQIINCVDLHKKAETVEQIRKWVNQRELIDPIEKKLKELEHQFKVIRKDAFILNIPNIPAEQSEKEWKAVDEYCIAELQLAKNAEKAWVRRDEKTKVEQQINNIVADWTAFVNDVPLCAAWIRGQGASFDKAINSFDATPSQQTISSAKSVLNSEALRNFISVWKTILDIELEINSIENEISNLPNKSQRINAWWHKRPDTAYVIDTKPSELPSDTWYSKKISEVEKLLSDEQLFQTDKKPELEKLSAEELAWAQKNLKNALQLLPDSQAQVPPEIHDCTINNEDWPIDKINDLFARYQPENIEAEIGRIDAKSAQMSFEEAKAEWFKRLNSDEVAIRAVRDLEKSISRNYGRVDENKYQTYQDVLRAVPIWITTAQAAQAIPLIPNLFDVIIIDEASQCTVTNLLPIMFRGKSLAVIGDEEQLPAIPVINKIEENVLARKYKIEDHHLDIVGHASNDVYEAAVESLPSGKDVVWLNEHYRSNPQIIGFSNRYIYQQKLELRRNPEQEHYIPIPERGVHRRNVKGEAKRGPMNSSWLNMIEADRVIELIKEIRASGGSSATLGVVTPFSAQKKLLLDMLAKHDLLSDVTVDSAHGFQGDERDIMIFSPVISPGITPSACRWVEEPPNLINVALTRARETLYIVANFDYCQQQKGKLRDLAEFVKDIELLRRTSKAELELFSWLVTEGLTPKVHPKIGDIEVDFLLEDKKIVIEVDGKQFHENRQEQDEIRDINLKGRGYKVLRFSAREVFETPNEIINRIQEKSASTNLANN